MLTLTKSPIENTSIKDLNIPLIIRGDRVGVIEGIIFKKNEFPEIYIQGVLIKELQNPEALIKLLQSEGLHLGKPLN